MNTGILIVYLGLILLVTRNNGSCNYPCNRQFGGLYINVIGGEHIFSKFSCSHPSTIWRDNTPFECAESLGPFSMQRRNGNEYRCAKNVTPDSDVTFSMIYATRFDKYSYVPSICEVCGKRKDWKLFLDVVVGTPAVIVKQFKDHSIKPVGDTIPYECRTMNLFNNGIHYRNIAKPDVPCDFCKRPLI